MLLLAALAVLPATGIAWADQFALRQFAPIALFGALIVALALCAVGTRLGALAHRAALGRLVAIGVGVVVLGAFVVPIARVGTHVTIFSAPPLDRNLASWLDANTSGPQTVAST